MKKPSERLTVNPQSANTPQPDFAIEFIAPETTPPAKKSGPKLIPPNAPPSAKKSNSILIPPGAKPPTRKSGALQLISPDSTPPAKKSSARLIPPSSPAPTNESDSLELIPPDATPPARKSGSMSAVKSSNSKRPAVGTASRSGERQKVSSSNTSMIAAAMVAGGLLLAGIGVWMITRKGNPPREVVLAAADKKDAPEKLEKNEIASADPVKKESAQPAAEELQIAQTKRKDAGEATAADSKNATSAPANSDKDANSLGSDKLGESNVPEPKGRAEPAAKEQAVVPQQIEISIPAAKDEAAPESRTNKRQADVDDIDDAADKKKKEQKGSAVPQENNPFKRPDAKAPEQAAKGQDPKQNNDFGKIGLAPQALCPICAGTKHIPILPGKQYVWMQGEGAKPADAVPWKMCPKCQKDADANALLQAETARLANHTARHQELKQGTKLDLVQSETPAVTLHSQLPAALTKTVAQNLEDLRIHLQKTTASTVLTPTRPDTHEIIIVKDTVAYNAYIDLLAKSNPGVDFALARKASGSTGRNSSFYNANLGMRAPPPEHMALFQLGQMFMREATDGKAPAWLVEGFAAYGENAVTKKNLCYSFAYDFNEVKFGINWNADIKKFAKDGKLKPWAQVFPLELVGMKSLDYLTCYSVVCFLMNDPHRFVNFVNELRAGTNSIAALEKAYGQKLEALQNAWGTWTLR